MSDSLLWPGDPLHGLQVRAALLSGWPTVHVTAADEGELRLARQAVEATIGSVPQADEIEPFDPSDPADPWELRIDLPDLEDRAWSILDAALAPWRHTLAVGLSAGAREAWDTGRLVADVLDGGVVEAVMASIPELATVQAPDLEVLPGQPYAALDRPLVEAIRQVHPGLQFHSEAGPDRAEAVVHRWTGRSGVRLAFDRAALDPLPGDVLEAMRGSILGAVGSFLAGRDEEPLLAPDVVWDARWGLSLVLWLVRAPRPVVRTAMPVQPGRPVPRAVLERLQTGLIDFAQDVEIQVVPRDHGSHLAAVEAVVAAAEGVELIGARPRWLGLEGSSVFSPVWRAPLEACVALEGVLERVLASDAVAGVRVVPGVLEGLTERWAVIDTEVTQGPGIWAVRYRDGLEDRDLLGRVGDRPKTGRDRVVEKALVRTLMAVDGVPPLARGGSLLAPIADTVGREGLELALSLDAANAWRLPATVHAIARAIDTSLAPVVTHGRLVGDYVMRMWFVDRPPVRSIRRWG